MANRLPSSMYLKWRIPAKQANNSLSKAEYFCWATSSFF
jgi:hypothetical protein